MLWCHHVIFFFLVFRPAVYDTLLPLCPLFLPSTIWFFFLRVTINIFICGFLYLFCLGTASLYIYITRTCSLQPLSLSHALFSPALFPFALSPSLSLFCSLSLMLIAFCLILLLLCQCIAIERLYFSFLCDISLSVCL